MGRADLGLSEAEFWALSPRTYRALLDRQRERTRRAEDAANIRAGVIAAAVLNSAGGKKNGGSFTAKDFFRFDQQMASRPRPSNEPLPPAEQTAVEAGWLAWASAATAAAARKGLPVGN